MIDPIGILKSDCAEAFAENDRLRALNAELLEALRDLSIAADTAESRLREHYPARAQSLHAKVAKSIAAIAKAEKQS